MTLFRSRPSGLPGDPQDLPKSPTVVSSADVSATTTSERSLNASSEFTLGAIVPAAVTTPLPEGLLAVQQADARHYAAVIGRLRSAGHDRDTRDTLGVCLMRTGGVEEALSIYRRLVLNPGCTWTRHDLPDRIKRNFATCLLLSGLPSGALEVLDETSDRQSERRRQIIAAVDRWAARLPLWRRWIWRLGSLEPRGAQIAIDFVPGELADESVIGPQRNGRGPQGKQGGSAAA